MSTDFTGSSTDERGQIHAAALEAIDALERAGRLIDDLSLRYDRATAAAEDRRREAARQAVGAMSREVWRAHTATFTVARAVQQLAVEEAR